MNANPVVGCATYAAFDRFDWAPHERSSRCHRFLSLGLVLIGFFLLVDTGFSATFSWISGSDGNWSNSTLWDPTAGAPPDAAGETAIVPMQSGTASYTISLDINPTIDAFSLLDPNSTLALNGHVLTSGTVINNGTIVDSAGSRISASQFDLSGTLAGSGTLAVTGTFNWIAGAMSGTGVTNIADSASIISGSNKSISARTLSATGFGRITIWSGTDAIVADNGASFINGAGATWNATADQSIVFSGSGTPATFNNNAGGIFNKSGAGTNTRLDTIFNNSSTVNVNSGALTLSRGGSDTGTFSVASGSALTFGGGTHTLTSSASVKGAGTVNITSGTMNFAGSPNNFYTTGPAFISGGVANFDSMAQTGTTVFSSGVISGTGSYMIFGALIWSGGTMAGGPSLSSTYTGVTNAVSGVLLNGGTKILTGRLLDSYYSGSWTSGDIWSGNSAVFVQAPGTFTNSFDGNFLFNQGGARPQFLNYGIFLKSSGTGTTLMEASFSNLGTLYGAGAIKVNSGTFILAGGGTNGSIFGMANGAVLRIQDNDYNITNGAVISGTGTFDLNSANTIFTGVTSGSTTFLISGGTGTFNGTMSITGSTTLAGGVLGGSGTLNTFRPVTWSGGVMTGDPASTADVTNANGGLVLSGTTKTFIARTLTNTGTATWSSGDIVTGNSAIFNNTAGSTFTNSFDGNFLFNQGGAQTQFNNSGTFTKSGSSGVTTVQAIFVNSGTTNVNSGTLLLAGGGTNSRVFKIAAGASLQIQSTDYTMASGAVISGSGILDFNSANTTFTGTSTNTANFLLSGGTGTFNGVTTTSGSTMLSAGVMAGTGTFNANGPLIWSGGTMSGPGVTNVNGGFTLDGGTKVLDGRTLTNSGTAIWSAGFISAQNGAIINNAIGATFTDSFDGMLFLGDGALPQFNNGGTFIKSGSSGGTTILASFINSGTVNVDSGSLTLTEGIQGPAGTVIIAPGATFVGALAPGRSSSVGILANSGTLAVNVNSFTVSTDYTNASFGSGNSFNPHASVTGTGQLLAAGNTTQSVSGDVMGGTTALPVMAFGNMHVGGSATQFYSVLNTGTSGPALRGALQTTTNGASITDSRLTGSGVTAGDFGPLASGSSTGNFAVTFTGASVGALDGQFVTIINNFDNVVDQLVQLTGTVFRSAQPGSQVPEPVILPNVHIGSTDQTTLSTTNIAVNDGFSEKLDAVVGGVSGDAIASGSVNLLAPQSTDNNSLVVGLDTTTPGAKVGQATIAFASNGDGTSGLGVTKLPLQIVNVSGTVYRLASASMQGPEPVSFGNVHAGTIAQRDITIANSAPNDGFSEKLDVAIGNVTGNGTASGSIALLGPGASDSTSLAVGINTTTPGVKSGSISLDLSSDGAGTSNLGSTVLASQTINVSGTVFRFASASAPTPKSVNFGIVHINEVPSQTLSIANTAINDGFSEKLDVLSGGLGDATASGSITHLSAGNSNSTGLAVGVMTSSAGNKSGTVVLTMLSDGEGTSSLGISVLGGQTVAVQAQVNFFADPVLLFKNGAATLTRIDPTHYKLDFGTLSSLQAPVAASFDVQNVLHDLVFQDMLGGSFDISGVMNYTLANGSGSNLSSGIAAGGSIDQTVTFDPSGKAGNTYSETLVLNPTSSNASTNSNLDSMQITLQAQVAVPEPGAWSLLGIGLAPVLCGAIRKMRYKIDQR
jgi:hypothetical protein